MALKNVKTQSGNPIAVFIAVFIIDGIIPSLLKNVLTSKFNTKLKTLCWGLIAKNHNASTYEDESAIERPKKSSSLQEDGEREMKTPIMNSKDILKPCCSSPDENAGLVEFCKAKKFIFQSSSFVAFFVYALF